MGAVAGLASVAFKAFGGTSGVLRTAVGVFNSRKAAGRNSQPRPPEVTVTGGTHAANVIYGRVKTGSIIVDINRRDRTVGSYHRPYLLLIGVSAYTSTKIQGVQSISFADQTYDWPSDFERVVPVNVADVNSATKDPLTSTDYAGRGSPRPNAAVRKPVDWGVRTDVGENLKALEITFSNGANEKGPPHTIWALSPRTIDGVEYNKGSFWSEDCKLKNLAWYEMSIVSDEAHESLLENGSMPPVSMITDGEFLYDSRQDPTRCAFIKHVANEQNGAAPAQPNPQTINKGPESLTAADCAPTGWSPLVTDALKAQPGELWVSVNTKFPRTANKTTLKWSRPFKVLDVNKYEIPVGEEQWFHDRTNWKWSENPDDIDSVGANPALVMPHYLFEYSALGYNTTDTGWDYDEDFNINWYKVTKSADVASYNAKIRDADTTKNPAVTELYEPRYVLNASMTIGGDSDTDRINLGIIAGSCNGEIGISGESWYIDIPSVIHDTQVELADDDLIGYPAVDSNAPVEQLFNTVTGTFFSRDHDYVKLDSPKRTIQQLVDAEGELPFQLDLPGVVRNTQVQRLFHTFLREQQSDTEVITFDANWKAAEIDVGTTFQFPAIDPFTSPKVFRANSVTTFASPQAPVSITATEYNSDVYIDLPVSDYHMMGDDNIVYLGQTEPYAPTGFAATAIIGGIELKWNRTGQQSDYIVYASETSSWQHSSRTVVWRGNATSFTHIVSSQRYYWIRAFLGGRQSLRAPNDDVSTVTATPLVAGENIRREVIYGASDGATLASTEQPLDAWTLRQVTVAGVDRGDVKWSTTLAGADYGEDKPYGFRAERDYVKDAITGSAVADLWRVSQYAHYGLDGAPGDPSRLSVFPYRLNRASNNLRGYGDYAFYYSGTTPGAMATAAKGTGLIAEGNFTNLRKVTYIEIGRNDADTFPTLVLEDIEPLDIIVWEFDAANWVAYTVKAAPIVYDGRSDKIYRIHVEHRNDFGCCDFSGRDEREQRVNWLFSRPRRPKPGTVSAYKYDTQMTALDSQQDREGSYSFYNETTSSTGVVTKTAVTRGLGKFDELCRANRMQIADTDDGGNPANALYGLKGDENKIIVYEQSPTQWAAFSITARTQQSGYLQYSIKLIAYDRTGGVDLPATTGTDDVLFKVDSWAPEDAAFLQLDLEEIEDKVQGTVFSFDVEAELSGPTIDVTTPPLIDWRWLVSGATAVTVARKNTANKTKTDVATVRLGAITEDARPTISVRAITADGQIRTDQSRFVYYYQKIRALFTGKNLVGPGSTTSIRVTVANTEGGNIRYDWTTTGEGSSLTPATTTTSLVENTVALTAPQSGQFDVMCKVTDSTGEPITFTFPIKVVEIAGTILGAANSVAGRTVQYTLGSLHYNTTGTPTYAWTTSAGSLSATNTKSINLTYPTAGTVELGCTVTVDGVSKLFTRRLTVEAVPDLSVNLIVDKNRINALDVDANRGVVFETFFANPNTMHELVLQRYGKQQKRWVTKTAWKTTSQASPWRYPHTFPDGSKPTTTQWRVQYKALATDAARYSNEVFIEVYEQELGTASVSIDGPSAANPRDVVTLTATPTNVSGYVRYSWSRDSGTLLETAGRTVRFECPRRGTATVTVAVTNLSGVTVQASKTITVTESETVSMALIPDSNTANRDV